MQQKNLSPKKMFERWAHDHKPACSFLGSDFGEWKQATLPKVLETLGQIPEKITPEAEFLGEWKDAGLIKQRWLINVSKYIAAELIINMPENIDKTRENAAILCCHGHGKFGKEPVMGNVSYSEVQADIDRMNYNYGHKMAQQGYVTFAIDWIAFGARNDSNPPHSNTSNAGRDWCNLYYLHATMLGTTSLAINIAHGKAAIDFVASMPYVNSNKLGVMGLSGGGTMALWMGLCDERLKAIEIIGYSGSWKKFGIPDNNYCGMQVAPGLFNLVDVADLQGLLAPCPLLVDIGANDTTFSIGPSLVCFEQVKNIYKAAGATDKLQLDQHAGGHAWGETKAYDFFDKYLKN